MVELLNRERANFFYSLEEFFADQSIYDIDFIIKYMAPVL